MAFQTCQNDKIVQIYNHLLRCNHHATPPIKTTNMMQNSEKPKRNSPPGIPPRLTPNSPVKKVLGRKTIAISDMV